MFNKKIFLIVILIFCVVALTSAYGADVAKIGLIDLQKILEKSNAGKAAQVDLQKKGDEMQSNMAEKGKEIQELMKKLEADSLILSAEARDQKKREIRIKQNDFNSLKKKYENDLKVINQKLVLRIRKKVLEIVASVGKKEGYLMIMEKSMGQILYAPSKIDITDKIIKIYNDQFANQNENSSDSE